MITTEQEDCTVYRFTVKVNCPEVPGILDDDRTDGTGVEYDDCGFIIMPHRLSDPDQTVRLVISCHGAGGTVETNDSQIEQQTLTKYLVSNGYAVMDVNGLPEKLAAEKGIDIRNNIGSYLAVQSYVNAYRLVTAWFNLKPNVLVMGASMGGISSTNLVLSGGIPVLAQAGFCPVLDTYHQIYLHPWSGGLPREALGILYHLEKDSDGHYLYNEEKIGGFNPMGKCRLTETGEIFTYPVPVSFWQCEDDPIVSVETTKRFVRAVNRAGGIAQLHTFPHGGHEPQDVGDAISDPSGITVFNRKTLDIKPAVEGVFAWFHQFG